MSIAHGGSPDLSYDATVITGQYQLRDTKRRNQVGKLLKSLVVAGAFGCTVTEAPNSESAWNWVKPPQESVWGLRIERAGWRRVGTFEEDGQQYAEWAWLVEVGGSGGEGWSGPVLIFTDLYDEVGLRISDYQAPLRISGSRGQFTFRFESGDTHQEIGRETVLAHRLTDDAHLRLTIRFGRDCERVPPEGPCEELVPRYRADCDLRNMRRGM